MPNPLDLLNLISPDLVREIYTDGAKNTLQEASKIGVDAVKTIRLALFPLQFTAAFQDRLAAYIDRAIRQVPEENRVAPRESLVLPIAERLRFQEEDSAISNLYVNLLSRGMDRERLGEAHPAFVNIVTQLAPDEVLLLEQLSSFEYLIYFRFRNERIAVLKAESDSFVGLMPVADSTKKFLVDRSVVPEALAQPTLFLTFLEHLVSLGLVEYDNEPRRVGELQFVRLAYPEAAYFCIKLSQFGKLFHKACVQAN
ncbi:Abi-alpha family protein [Uliginosibacterium sp. H3]|uniref:Abi-alpha family protein n=1 Tax=Uliginosibacterium silvisoli TaxID=3114758 RepID=A0ABU6K7Y7_9RHOO|nr:Abi-alpha family protein [Uliginosibacterium sp. H3]